MDESIKQILEVFVEKAHELKGFKFEEHVKSEGLGFRVHRDNDKEEWIIEFGQANKKEIDAFLFTFRLFIQHNEPISFHGMKGLLADSQLPVAWKNKVEKAIEAYFDYYDKYPSDIQDLFGKRPTNGEILDTVLYGEKGHTGLNPKYRHKRKKFQEWTRDDIRANVLLQVFTRVVINVSKLIYFIADANEQVLKDEYSEI